VAGVPDQRRADLQDGAVRTGEPGQDVAVPERVEQRPGEGAAAGRVLAAGRAGDLDAGDQAGAADIAEAGVLAGQVAEPGPQVISDGRGALGDALARQDVEDGEPGGRGGGGGGEGGEVLVVTGQAVGDLPAGDEGADRVAGAHRLAEGDEVGGDARGGEAPEGGADPPVAGLDLVGEEQGASGAGAVDESGDEVRRGVEDALAGEAQVG